MRNAYTIHVRGYLLLTLALAAFATIISVPFTAKAQSSSEEAYELEVLQSMVEKHTTIAELSELCIDGAERASLQDKCESMRDAALSENDHMQDLADDWYGEDLEESVPSEWQDDIDRAEDQSNGNLLEHAVLDSLIDVHQSAADLAEECADNDNTYHNTLMDLCEDMDAAHTAEYNLLRSWHDSWFHQGDDDDDNGDNNGKHDDDDDKDHHDKNKDDHHDKYGKRGYGDKSGKHDHDYGKDRHDDHDYDKDHDKDHNYGKDGRDGYDGKDGHDGKDGRDGKDGKDGDHNYNKDSKGYDREYSKRDGSHSRLFNFGTKVRAYIENSWR